MSLSLALMTWLSRPKLLLSLPGLAPLPLIGNALTWGLEARLGAPGTFTGPLATVFIVFESDPTGVAAVAPGEETVEA